MALLPIRRFGDPVLRENCRRINRIDDPELQTLIDDMIETMRTNDGVGLAAPQIGLPIRLTVIEIPGAEEGDPSDLYVLINPEITKRHGKRVVTEGCLSLPNWFGEVTRSVKVGAKFLDRNGHEVRVQAEGLFAQAIEHEVDHLNGRLFTDILTSPDKLWKSEQKPSKNKSDKVAAGMAG